jgi:hypothetical protein
MPGFGPPNQLGRGFLALLDRQPAQIRSVKLEQVECAQHGGVVVTPGTDQLKHRERGLVADDDLAVDQARTHRQRHDGRHDQKGAFGEIVAVAGDQAHALAVAPGQDPSCLISWIQLEPAGGARHRSGAIHLVYSARPIS